MGKEKKYLAIVTKNGIPEALYLDFLEKNPTFKKEWQSKAIKSYGVCNFEEATEEEVEKGTDKYIVFYDKERDREKKEFAKQKEEKIQESKTQKEPDEIIKPQPIQAEEKEDSSEDKPRKRSVIKKRKSK
jgi:hypothetical protein